MVTFLLSMKPMHNSTSNGSADVVKRAYAQTRLSNKALARVPRSTKLGKTQQWYPAGSTLNGVIYSNTWNIHKYVGFDVSLNTYVSAANNRYSLFYTEVINRWYRQSGYGKK